MINSVTHFRINVIALPGEAMFVVVPAEQAPDVRRLLEQHGIAHTEQALAAAAHNRAAAQHVIHIAPASDPRQVQAILDRAP